MRIGSLFSGAGGLDMAVEAVFGGEVIWQAEVDKAASKVLAYRFPCAPNLGDITRIDWTTVETPDVLCGGFPCQDVSAAGKRAGIKDGTRSGLWSVFADVIDHVRPTWVVIENVRGLLSARAHRNLEPDDRTLGDGSDGPVLRAAGAVLGDLADLGYDAQWATVAAADVGAPHRRERVFIVARTVSYTGHDAGRPEQGVKYKEQTGGVGKSSDRAASRARYGDESERAWQAGREAGERFSVGDVVGRGGETAAVSGDEPGVALLPTPCVVDRLATTDMTLDQWDESRRSQKERGVGSFGPRGDSLGAAVLRVEEGTVDERPDFSTRGALLPTPTSRDHKGQANPDGRERNGRPRTIGDDMLPDAVSRHLLPTPRTSDTNGAGLHGDGGMDLRTTISLLPTPKAHDGEFGTPRTTGRPIEKFTHLGTIASLEQTSHWGKYEPAIRRWEAIVGPAPAPTEPNKNGNPRLSAAFSEWLMGWPAGWATDPDIGISRNDQLRIIGNGVCPQQAVAALRFLLTVSEVAA